MLCSFISCSNKLLFNAKEINKCSLINVKSLEPNCFPINDNLKEIKSFFVTIKIKSFNAFDFLNI